MVEGGDELVATRPPPGPGKQREERAAPGPAAGAGRVRSLAGRGGEGSRSGGDRPTDRPARRGPGRGPRCRLLRGQVLRLGRGSLRDGSTPHVTYLAIPYVGGRVPSLCRADGRGW